MAQLLNYIKKSDKLTASDILNKYLTAENQDAKELASRKLGLYFTDAGQIYTHGVNYISNSNPTFDYAVKTYITSDTTVNATDKVFSTKGVIDLVTNKLSSAMLYMGSINQTSDIPTDPKVGDTYKVATAGTYNVNGSNIHLEIGDTLICETKKDDKTAAKWTVIQNNIDIATALVNGSSAGVYGTGTWLIYAPTSEGTKDLVLVSSGSGAPVWTSASNITSGTASKVANALTVASSNGLTLKNASGVVASYNGSEALTLALALASTSNAGTVKIGSNITVTNGTISVTEDNVTSALGYTPVRVADGVTSISGIVTNNATSIEGASAALDNPYYNILKTINGTKSVGASLQFFASTGIKITGTEGKITIENTIANTWRPIKLNQGSIGDNTLNFVNNENILVASKAVNDVTGLGFALRWAIIGSDGTVSYETV